MAFNGSGTVSAGGGSGASSGDGPLNKRLCTGKENNEAGLNNNRVSRNYNRICHSFLFSLYFFCHFKFKITLTCTLYALCANKLVCFKKMYHIYPYSCLFCA